MLSQNQHEILSGLLLGDGCLFLGKTNKNPLFTLHRAEKDKEYLEYHFDIFKNLCTDKGLFTSDKFDKKRNKIYKGFKFRTRALSDLKDYFDLWYPNGKKIIPTNLELTPTTVATWFCDDGSIMFKSLRSGEKSKSALRMKLSTNSFSKLEVEFLVDKLSILIGDFFSIQKDSLEWYKKQNPSYEENNNKNYYILTYTEGAYKFYEYIKDHFPNGMERKLNIWKEFEVGRLGT